ncbi:expressed unknown protein [Seminavis robusta]|uniref:Transmembrane protein n=1 Tax=Seminavis robusta TaxID=568900 RepID=A0A9N8HH36_9STRA|nr:expressed unknown protein [Seminavis robusta]|eukprot:Sro516_g158540.1 n/a (262) ;mRNA; r:35811-36596
MMSFEVSGVGLLGASVTVAATTLDDAVWLVPYVGSSSKWSTSARVVHAFLFLLTLLSLAVASVLVAFFITRSVTLTSSSTVTDENSKRQEILMGAIAATLCWILAIFFYVKKWLKRRRRQRQEEERLIRLQDGESEGPNYDSTKGTTSSSPENQPPSEDHGDPTGLSCSSIGTVISLTMLGALDELSYFPALLVGKIFTPWEICLGTLLAAIFILLIVTCCLARCKPLADCLDRIPIYTVIALFATILTLGVLFDALWDDR